MIWDQDGGVHWGEVLVVKDRERDRETADFTQGVCSLARVDDQSYSKYREEGQHIVLLWL